MYEKLFHKLAAVCTAAAMLTASAPASVIGAETDTAPISLMCLGDSITDGFWLSGGYRNTLCARIEECGQKELVDFVGPNWGGTGYDPQHAGYSGYSIANIAQQDSISGQRTGLSGFIDWLLESHPADVIFLQIGTNDILSLYDLEHFGARLESLVDAILKTIPDDGMLYLATLPCMDATNTLYISEYHFTVESMDKAVDDCNAQIRAVAEKKRAQGKPIQLAEVNKVLTKADLYDGVHPSEAGYQKLGNFWFDALQCYFKGEELPQQTTVTTAEATVYTTETTASASVSGDVNGDGALNVADAVALAKHLTGETPLDAAAAKQADVNSDLLVNAKDITLLKRKLVSNA